MTLNGSKILALFGLFFITLLTGTFWTLAIASPSQNLQVGVAQGPTGRTNIQTLANFEDGILYTSSNPNAEGYGFAKDSNFTISLANCGPGNSTKCLRVHNANGYYPVSWKYKHSQLWWSGPRQGLNAYNKQSIRANSHSVQIKGFDELSGASNLMNLEMGTYHKRYTPSQIATNNPESDNMHAYFQTKVDWGGAYSSGGGPWREIVWRANPTAQRSSGLHEGGYELFAGYAGFWPDFTRFYYQFLYSGAFNQPADVFIDNLIWFYENPFMAGFPHATVQHGVAGQPVTFDAILWNTHPTKSRNFHIQCSGWDNHGVSGWSERWSCGGVSIMGNSGNSVSGRSILETGQIPPGSGFAFQITVNLPNDAPINDWRRLIVNAYEDPANVPNTFSYQQPAINYGNVTANRYDLPGIGYSFKVVSTANPVSIGNPTPLNNLQVTGTGGSWADLSWLSPATAQLSDETTNDPAAATYAIRYSEHPISDDSTWDTAIPVESVPPIFGSGIPQRYSLKGLKANTQYYAAVRVYNENGVASSIESSPFQTKSADLDGGNNGTPPDLIPPSPPQGLLLQ